MMDCLMPVMLKSGLAVPCGKCALCRSNIRNEWSIRLAIHLANCERMPMFITLTYNDKYVPVTDNGIPTLKREDVSKFLKAYKRKYCLKNEDFQYFGCGEYGENFRRPHYHLLFFGDFQLYEDFFKDTELAQKRITDVWKFGFVHIGVAGFDGIHYVTKYCLKDDLESIPDCARLPFTIASNGLGSNIQDSLIGLQWKKQLEYLSRHKDRINKNAPALEYDYSNMNEVLLYFHKYVPSFKVILDDGRKVFLPRALRKKFIGSFEHFKDSPLWYYNSLLQLSESVKYYSQFKDYDNCHEQNMSLVRCVNRLDKIRKRLLEKKYNSKIKNL